ncbi:MAG: CBS domain-containing protein [Nitrospira sp.]|nr:CBS domain-containing protein [Nitrospira sp.]
MPLIITVNGVVQTYQSSPVGARHAPAQASEVRDHPRHTPPSSEDHRASIAQQTYQRLAHPESRLRAAVVARDLMTSPVITLASTHTLGDAWHIMTTKGFRHLPITSLDGILVGLVSERDLLSQAPDLIMGKSPSAAAHIKLAEIMTTRVISATPSTDIRDIARIMLDERIHAVPILDGNRHPVGIVSSRDLLRGIANHGPLELWT